MKESLNQVDITGVVSEISIRDIEKEDKKYICGDVVIKVEEKGETSYIPVGFISANIKKDGTPNKIYEQLQNLRNYNSIASAGEEAATKVQIKGARLEENFFVPNGGTEVLSFTKISSNFFNKSTGIEFNEGTTFRVIGSILKIEEEEKTVEGEMQPTGRLVIRAAVVRYGDKVDVVKFIVEDEAAKTFILGNWKEGDTVRIGGRLRYTVETFEKEEEVGFGEADVKTYTRKVRELLVERGSAGALEDELCYDKEDIKKALIERKSRMGKTKEKAEQPKPVQNIAKSSSDDFGF